jgi:Cu(I)/Ag(I) efflux system periplasmic protein CusF
MKSILATLLALSAIALSGAAHAGHGHDTKAPDAKAAPAAAADMTEAEVRKVDKEQGKITLKHGEIKSLDMPAMTMVFRVKDAALLDKVAPGDKIKFQAEKVNGAFTVTHAEKLK